MLFNIFICLHIFNLVNCREINETRFNPFTALYKNWIFFAIVAAIAAFQYVMVEYGGIIARTSGLDEKQHAFSVLIGSSALVASLIIKILPEGISKFLVPKIEDHEIAQNTEENRYVKLFNSFSNTKASDLFNAAKNAHKRSKLGKSKLVIEASDPYA